MSLTSTGPSMQAVEETDATGASEATPNGLSVAAVLTPLLEQLIGTDNPIRFEFWDGSATGPSDAKGIVRIISSDAIRRIMWMPDELGLSRAFVAGDLDVDGDLYAVIETLRTAGAKASASRVAVARDVLAAARRLGVLGKPLDPPAEEPKLTGLRHSVRRDSRAIAHHYDVGNDFFRLVLGPTMTYSCARFVDETTDLDDAQIAKYELICRKLGLHERSEARLLDVGCGWGSMVTHAAARHGATAVGITISEAQAAVARERVAEAGLSDRIEIRLQDYRELTGEKFDAISSIGMSEHVGHEQISKYFSILRNLLSPTGRLLNHAISSVGGSKLPRNSFMGRYVFPDAELIDVSKVVLAMERVGFEVRDVESLREHYAKTTRAWVRNLEANWDRVVELVGESRARIWRLYMAGGAVAFEDGRAGLHQVLGIVPSESGGSGMPPTRRAWD